MYLARYHDVTISTSGVWRILKRLGMNRLPASQRYQRRTLRWKRYEKQRPGHQLQVERHHSLAAHVDSDQPEALPRHRCCGSADVLRRVRCAHSAQCSEAAVPGSTGA